MKIPAIFVPEKNLECGIEKLLEGKIKPMEYNKFEVIYANTYAEGIAKLKEQGRKPFTFPENVEARIADYEANGDDAALLKTPLDSVTGIAYKAHSTKFKLILKSDKLENIKPGFNQNFVPVDYVTEQGIEFDSIKDKYNKLLTREKAKNHEFWIAAMGGDKEKLAEYVDTLFNKTGKNKGMGVYLRKNTSQDELRAIVLYSDEFYSSACGDIDRLSYYYAGFVSGAQ